MLHQIVEEHRYAIISRARGKLTARPWPSAAVNALESGVPLFLTQLSDTLTGSTDLVASDDAITASAIRHGRDLLGLGFTVSQVVHDYGDICQALTEVALEQGLAITTDEFHTLNRCLDTAIAEAVTECARITAESSAADQVERSGLVAQRLRGVVNTSLFAFEALQRGAAPIDGGTGAVLGRSLMDIRDFVDSALSDARVAGNRVQRERVHVASFLATTAVAARLHAAYRGIDFILAAVDQALAIEADPQLLASAVANLLSNAFKYTHDGGRVVLTARGHGARLLIAVEDQCGGLPETASDLVRGDWPVKDWDAAGMGIAIARRAVRAHGGDLRVYNLPGSGCIFEIDLALAPVVPGAPAR